MEMIMTCIDVITTKSEHGINQMIRKTNALMNFVVQIR